MTTTILISDPIRMMSWRWDSELRKRFIVVSRTGGKLGEPGRGLGKAAEVERDQASVEGRNSGRPRDQSREFAEDHFGLGPVSGLDQGGGQQLHRLEVAGSMPSGIAKHFNDFDKILTLKPPCWVTNG